MRMHRISRDRITSFLCNSKDPRFVLISIESRCVDFGFDLVFSPLMNRFSHPDKNPDPESKKLFVKIATAYEVTYLV